MQVKITKVTKEILQADSSNFLAVEFDLVEGEGDEEKVVLTRKHAFPFGTASDVIKAELEKFAETYQLEQKQAEENAEAEELEKLADQTIDELVRKDK